MRKEKGRFYMDKSYLGKHIQTTCHRGEAAGINLRSANWMTAGLGSIYSLDHRQLSAPHSVSLSHSRHFPSSLIKAVLTNSKVMLPDSHHQSCLISLKVFLGASTSLKRPWCLLKSCDLDWVTEIHFQRVSMTATFVKIDFNSTRPI